MAKTVSDFLIERLRAWGVTRIFGFPGDGINGITGALNRAGDDAPEFVQVRHEEMAAFMACAHAKLTGEVGVCMATSGPGAIHLLNGLYDAKLDHAPVLAIVGQQARAAMGGSYQQEVDLASLFKDVASEYVHMATEPSQTRHLVDRAMRVALAERSVTCLIFPNDLQEMDYAEPARAHGTVHSSLGYTRPLVVPQERDLQRAAEILNAGQRVAILVGAGALHATDEVIAVAEALGAGVAKALLGKAALPDDLPFVTGSIGLLGTKASWELMAGCDTLLMVGTSFPYSEFLPKEGQARGIQIDIQARMLGLRYPTELNLVGDAAVTLAMLLPMLQRKPDRSWREKIEGEVADWWRTLDARADDAADPLNPQLVYRELSKRLPDGCILTCDSGSSASWYARYLRVRRGMMATLSGTLATMGPAVPYAIAAKFAYPDRAVVACVGDGAMQMNGMNELITMAKYWRRWKDPRLVVLVLNNRDLNMVTWEQRATAGDPKFDASQGVPDIGYADFARTLGLRGVRVSRPEEVASALDGALSADRPIVIDAVTDPDVPILPPHVTFTQAKNLASAILGGDSDAKGVIRQAARAAADGVFGGDRKKKDEG